jgi:uncharacterized membrane protein
MTRGPMQMLVVGFDDPNFTGEIAAELRRLRNLDVVRLVDLLVVRKEADGEVTALETSDLLPGESTQLGAFVGALFGMVEAGEAGAELGALAGVAAGEDGAAPLEQEVWFLADAIPAGTTAAVAILEHRWALPLRDAIERAGGHSVVDAWLHPADLEALEDALPEPSSA